MEAKQDGHGTTTDEAQGGVMCSYVGGADSHCLAHTIHFQVAASHNNKAPLCHAEKSTFQYMVHTRWRVGLHIHHEHCHCGVMCVDALDKLVWLRWSSAQYGQALGGAQGQRC